MSLVPRRVGDLRHQRFQVILGVQAKVERNRIEHETKISKICQQKDFFRSAMPFLLNPTPDIFAQRLVGRPKMIRSPKPGQTGAGPPQPATSQIPIQVIQIQAD